MTSLFHKTCPDWLLLQTLLADTADLWQVGSHSSNWNFDELTTQQIFSVFSQQHHPSPSRGFLFWMSVTLNCTGFAMPKAFSVPTCRIRQIQFVWPNLEGVSLSVHCHSLFVLCVTAERKQLRAAAVTAQDATRQAPTFSAFPISRSWIWTLWNVEKAHLIRWLLTFTIHPQTAFKLLLAWARLSCFDLDRSRYSSGNCIVGVENLS